MKHVTPQLQAWLGGELTADEARRVEEHLAGCADCRAEGEALQTVWAALEQAAPSHDGSSVWQAVQARTTEAPRAEWFFGGTRLWRASLVALTLAAGLLAGSLVPGGGTAVADELEEGLPWLSGATWTGEASDGDLDDLWLAETAAGEASP